MEKKGQMLKRNDNICHLDLYFYCCGQMIGWGGVGGNTLVVRFRGIFKISFLRVSINTLLCNLNLIHNENLLSLFSWT